MLKIFSYFRIRNFFLTLSLLLNTNVYSDNFDLNTYNNHGVVGLINTPTARFYDEGVHGITLYDGTPDQKITLSSNPYDWLEASFFYSNIQGRPYPGYEYQDYKDKGFNVKLRLKKEGSLPAIAIGLNDFAGTGLHSSEYIVASYGINKLDMHFGLGWGQLNGSDQEFKNPFTYLRDDFIDRPIGIDDKGGQFNPEKYFSGKTSSPFFGISYSMRNNLLLKLERDPTNTTNGLIDYEIKESEFSLGLDYSISSNFTIGASFERGNYISMRFIYKNNPKSSIKKYEYKEPEINQDDDKYSKLVKNLEKNGIGVNKITETSKSIGLELTQFIHPNLRVVEQIIAEATRNAGINKNVKKDIKIADLKGVSEIDDTFRRNAKTIYERQVTRRFNSSSGIRFKPFIASREEFFKNFIRIKSQSNIVDLPFYKEGSWWVQGLSSSLPVYIISTIFKENKKKGTVLDVGAAPGGKSFQLIDLGFKVKSIEISKKRILTFNANLNRLKINSKIINEDFLNAELKEKFDCILIDAPCSGSGLMQKKPEMLVVKKDISSLLLKQKKMLLRASSLVKDGGYIIYRVCSLLKEEGEKQIANFLDDQKCFSTENFFSDILKFGVVLKSNTFLVTPNSFGKRGGVDGFFIACLVKNKV